MVEGTSIPYREDSGVNPEAPREQILPGRVSISSLYSILRALILSSLDPQHPILLQQRNYAFPTLTKTSVGTARHRITIP